MQLDFAAKLSGRRLFLVTAVVLAIALITGACGKGSSTGGLSPTDTVKAYYEAGTKKDVAGLKKYLSKGTIALMEKGAKAMGKSLDDAIKEEAATNPPVAPTYGAEKITGETATVDVTVSGTTIAMPLIKEGGEWKIAMDKLIEKMGESLPTETRPTPAVPATPAATPSGPADDDDEHDNGNH